MAEPGSRAEVLYLVRSWPKLSQTFVLDEILGLERLGLRVRIVALARSGEHEAQRELEQLRAPVHYLGASGTATSARSHAGALIHNPAGYTHAVTSALRHTDWDRGYHVAGRAECLSLAVELAALLRSLRNDRGRRVAHLHAHFAHDPAAVAMLTHQLTGVPWSFTGHARDVWQVTDAALAQRVGSAGFVITCHLDTARRLESLVAPNDRGPVHVVHHGVDLEAFRPPAGRRRGEGRLHIVSVGRLTEKKGFFDLVAACRKLEDEGQAFRCTIVGDGPLRSQLDELVERLALGGRVTLAGARTRHDLRQELERADLFALTPFVTADGDRDGIPNVVVEAMACGLPVVATTAGGLGEVIRDGENGLLAEPRDVPGIADRMRRLIGDEQLRTRLGTAARRTALERFDTRAAAARLADLFRPALGSPG